MGTTVLVIEADDTLRVLMGEILSEEGYDVRLAWSGDVALRELDRCNPDLVVLDPRGPYVDGREFLRIYRAANRRIAPVLALSADGAPIDAEIQIPKPFNLVELLSAVQAGVHASAFALPS